MAGLRIFRVLCLAAGLLFVSSGISKGAISLRVNGEDTDFVVLELGQPCIIEIVSTDNSEYDALVGFKPDPLGTFDHIETKPQAGTEAGVIPWNEPWPFDWFYGYWVWSFGGPSPGVHFVFQYTGFVPHYYPVQLGLWLWDSIHNDFYQVDAVLIIVIPPPEFGACCNELTGDCYISEIWDCIYNWLGPGTDCSMCVAPPQEIKVEIHTVKGSGITEAQIREWIDKANQSDYPNVKFVVDSNHVYEPNTPYDPNKNEKCKVNIWGVKKNFWADRWPGIIDPNVSAQLDKVICLVPGDGNNIYIKDSTLAHELNHIFLGPEHSNDPNNKMCPDNDWHAGVLKSCHRKGTKLTSDQQKKIKEKAEKSGKASDAVIGRYGDEKYDNVGDVSFEYIDLAWMQGWIEWIQNVYLLHLTAQVRMLSFENYSEVGFYLESDNCLSTGQPPEGLDYYVAIQPASEQIIFMIYDTDWMSLDSEGISFEFTYANPDVNLPPIPTGVKFEMPLPLLQRRAGDVISFRAAAQNNVQMDVSPNVGLLSIELHPKPIPGDLNLDGKVDYDDLKIMTENWLKIDCSVADIYPALNVDNIVDFKDLAVLSTNWLEGPP